MRAIILISVFFSLIFLFLTACDSNISSEEKIVGYVDCSPFAARIEKEEFYKHTNCGTVDDTGLIQLKKEVVDLMDFAGMKDFKRKNPQYYTNKTYPDYLMCLPISASVFGNGGPAYFNEDGKGRITPVFDTASCIPFINDVSHTYIDGKAVFFNTNLEIVKRTNYRFVWGRRVCSEVPHKYYESGWEEHPKWRGGKCGVIDKAFNVIVPIEYPFEKIPSKMSESEHSRE